jgi:hypothetical protein
MSLKIKLCIAFAVLSTGCTMTVQLPKEDAFTPVPKAKQMTITLITAADPTAECKRLHPKELAFHPVVAACAAWNFDNNTCTVVVGNPTTNNVIGHEIRHCFEGAFHD